MSLRPSPLPSGNTTTITVSTKATITAVLTIFEIARPPPHYVSINKIQHIFKAHILPADFLVFNGKKLKPQNIFTSKVHVDDLFFVNAYLGRANVRDGG